MSLAGAQNIAAEPPFRDAGAPTYGANILGHPSVKVGDAESVEMS
jgi:hypothetical protein